MKTQNDKMASKRMNALMRKAIRSCLGEKKEAAYSGIDFASIRYEWRVYEALIKLGLSKDDAREMSEFIEFGDFMAPYLFESKRTSAA
jgi:hypothetical protein